jgi:intracellular sulfur oxidation DsrE/DsrF family protein
MSIKSIVPLFVSIVAMTLSAPATAAPPLDPMDEPLKVVVHLNYGDTERQGHTLKNLTNVLKDAPDTIIEVVCHGGGIELAVASKSAHAESIAALTRQGVRFVACENTMKQKMIAPGDLLPNVATVPSGTVELIKKQQREGFAYLRP